MQKFFVAGGLLIVVLGFVYFVAGFFKRDAVKGTVSAPAALVFYHYGDDAKVYQSLIAAYQKKNPKLKVVLKTFDNLGTYEDRLVNEMAEGRGPDLFVMPNDWFYRHIRKIQPAPTTLMSADAFRKTFVDTADRDLIRPDQAGNLRIFGFPMYVDSLAAYYNKDQFEDRLPSSGQPSDTWTGFSNDVFQLTKSADGLLQVAGAALGRADNISTGVDVLYAMMLQLHTELYGKGNRVATFATTSGGSKNPGIEALALFTSFADATQKNYSWNSSFAGTSSAPEVDAFAQGKASVIFGYSDTYQKIFDALSQYEARNQPVMNKASLRVAPFPQFLNPDASAQKRITLARYMATTVSRNSRYSAQAWNLLSFMTNQANLTVYSTETRRPPSRRDLLETFKKDPFYGVFALQSAYAMSAPIYNDFQFHSLFVDAVTRVVDGRETATSSLKKAEVSASALLPDEGFLGPGPYIPTAK
ncbi:MAG: extracellular solute-binding protein [Patescibacteria group bacterium]